MTESFDAFRERAPRILAAAPELEAYRDWLGQTDRGDSRDPIFAETKTRFEPRQQDVVTVLPSLVVNRSGGRTWLRSGDPEVAIELPGVSRGDAERMVGAIDGERCLLEVRWACGVDERVFAQFLRSAFGVAILAPASIAELDRRIPAVEVVRFPGSPYGIDRAYWANMADFRDHVARDRLGVVDAFVSHVRELHVVALMGRDLSSFYAPPSATRSVTPGSFCLEATRTIRGRRQTILLDGPRVDVSLRGGPAYYRRLYASVGDEGALGERSHSNEGVPWGEVVTAMSARDDRAGAWFIAPRPLLSAHWERLHCLLRKAEVAFGEGDREAVVKRLANFHQSFIRLRPFSCGNQTVAMGLVNAGLTRFLGAGIPHLLLDQFALRASEAAYEMLFERALHAFGVGVAETRPITLAERNTRAFALIHALASSTCDEQADDRVRADPDGARWALLA